MSKGQDSKKSVKKKPLLTAKEKKASKKSKKADANVLGHQDTERLYLLNGRTYYYGDLPITKPVA